MVHKQQHKQFNLEQLFPATSGCHGDKPSGWGLRDLGRHGNVLGGRGLYNHHQDPCRRSFAARHYWGRGLRGRGQEPPADWFFSKQLFGQMLDTDTRPAQTEAPAETQEE